jgi:hypothetical protein
MSPIANADEHIRGGHRVSAGALPHEPIGPW